MTCIVGLEHDGKVWIGADSAGVAGYGITGRVDPKVFRRGPYILGFAGSFRMGQLLHHVAELPIPDPDEVHDRDLEAFMVVNFVEAVRKVMKDGGFTEVDNNVETAGFFLVGVRGHLFEVECDWQVGRSLDGYLTLGCGDDLALGSLHSTTHLKDPKSRVTRALEAAAHHSAGVMAPFKVLAA